MEDPDLPAASNQTRTDPYSKLKNARFLPSTPLTSSIEIKHPSISLDIPNFPRIMKTKCSGELPYKIQCKLSGNWEAHGANSIVLDICLEVSESEFDDTLIIDTIVAGAKKLMIRRDGTATFELRFLEASYKYGDGNFNLKISVEDVGHNILLAQKSPPFFVYSHAKVIKNRANVEIRTVCPNQISFTNGGDLHLIGKTFFEGPRFKIFIKIGDFYEKVNVFEFYSSSVIFARIPPFPLISRSWGRYNEVEAEIMISNDGITHSNVMKIHYIRQ